jgi:hypothetical protein
VNRRVAFGALLVLAVVLGAYLSAARRTDGPPLDPRSTSAEGARGLVELLDRFGEVEVLDEVPSARHATAVVLQDRFDRGAEDRLRRWVEAGGTLVVADPGSTFTPPVAGTADGEVAVDCDLAGLGAVTALSVEDGLRYEVTGGAGTCTLTDGGDGALAIAEVVGDGIVVSVGGPSAFTNEHLDEADNAVLAVRLLVAQDGTRTAFLRPSLAVGGGEATLVDLVDTPVRAALVQLAIAFTLFALWRARRLGRPVPEPQPVQVESAELTAAVARLLSRSRAPGRAAAVLRDRARRQLSAPLGLPLDAPADLVVATLVARTSLDEAQAHRAAIAPVATDEDLVEVAALLARIREEITRGTPDRPRADQLA